ncbi:MAG: hypothetical protein JNL08_12925 [Planctomycetes bacterium]|nr:hypothetical protein [Planctomycetota bacterium]
MTTSHGGFAGTNFGFTDTAMFDPDGTGPQVPRLVCTAVDANAGPGGPNALGIATFDAATGTWSPLGSGIVQGAARHLVVLPTGELVVGGAFSAIGGVACTNIARWTGATFAPLGSGPGGSVSAMDVAPNGDLVAIAGSSVQRWDGSTWTSVGIVPANVSQLAFAANGDIVASHQGGFVRWNGSSWAPYAPGMTSVRNLATMPNGDLLAAGQLAGQPLGNLHFAVWNGTGWTALGASWNFTLGLSEIRDFLFLPNGDPVAVGQYMFQPFAEHIGVHRWDGAAWTAFSTTAGPGRSATFTPEGRLYVASAATLVSHQTTCPAQLLAAGNGCPGSGGANRLEVEERAWLGGTFRSRGHELPALAFAAAAYGFATLTVPLSIVFPQAPSGCDLLVTPDILQLVLVAGGQATSTMPIQPLVALLGTVFHHQIVPFEFDAGGALVSVTASNAVTASVGSF